MNRELTKMTWKEFSDAKATKPVIIPIGSLEQHGYHLPLATDVIISKNLAKLLAEEVDAIVAPPINYGYKSMPASGGGPLFPGTIDLNGATLVNVIYDILSEFARDGVKKIFLLNGHFENEPFIVEAMDLATQKHDVHVVLASWWDTISDEAVAKVFDEVKFPSWALEHAAITETSMVMYFEPELVHMERFEEETLYWPDKYHSYPVRPGIVPDSGVLATARTSSMEKGKFLVAGIVDEFARMYTKEFSKEELV